MKVEFKSMMDEISKIKQMFATNQKFAQATLEDGTVVEWDGDLIAGTELFIVDGETRIPAPVGTHITNEGLQIVVEEVGVVAEVIEAVAEDEEFEAEEEVKEIEDELVMEIADIINEATPEDVTEEDSGNIAEDVIEAVIEALEEVSEDEFKKMVSRIKKNKFSKTKKFAKKGEVNKQMNEVFNVVKRLANELKNTQRELKTLKAQPSVNGREKTKFTKEGGDLTPRQQFLMNNLKK